MKRSELCTTQFPICNFGHNHCVLLVSIRGSYYLSSADVNDAGQCSITRKGIFNYQDKASECTGTVNIGCRRPNEIVIDTMCPSHRSTIRHEEKGRQFIYIRI